MRYLYLLITLVAFPCVLTGQCFEFEIKLNSQTDVDDFPSTYGDCYLVSTRLRIDGSSITSLAPLAGLNAIGELTIQRTSLTDLSGLDDLQQVDGDLNIFFNQNLSSLNGLEKLSIVTQNLTITTNSNLVNLDGLQALRSVGRQTRLTNNSRLSDIGGLNGIDFRTSIAGTPLYIEDNYNLTRCHISSVCNLLPTNAGNTVIRFNGTGCSSVTEVSTACSAPATCNDGVRNGNETKTDCGGSCGACPAGPSCATPVQPGDGATEVPVYATTLTWIEDPTTTAVDITIGTVSGGNDFLSTTVAGGIEQLPLPALDYATDYFVTITARNSDGVAGNCSESSWRTDAWGEAIWEGTGDWSEGSNWRGGIPPRSRDRVIVLSGFLTLEQSNFTGPFTAFHVEKDATVVLNEQLTILPSNPNLNSMVVIRGNFTNNANFIIEAATGRRQPLITTPGSSVTVNDFFFLKGAEISFPTPIRGELTVNDIFSFQNMSIGIRLYPESTLLINQGGVLRSSGIVSNPVLLPTEDYIINNFGILQLQPDENGNCITNVGNPGTPSNRLINHPTGNIECGGDITRLIFENQGTVSPGGTQYDTLGIQDLDEVVTGNYELNFISINGQWRGDRVDDYRALRIGGSVAVNFNGSISPAIGESFELFRFRSGYTGTFDEISTSDGIENWRVDYNTANVTITKISSLCIDLEVTDVELLPYDGRDRVRITITNTGTAATTLETNIAFWISDDQNLNNGDEGVGGGFIPGTANLAPGASTTTVVNIRNVTPPRDYFLFVIDHSNLYDECSEGNNVTAFELRPGCRQTSGKVHNLSATATYSDGSCESCSDGIQNGDETDVDCGGSLCDACTIACTTITNPVSGATGVSVTEPISWSPVEGATGYRIAVGTTPGGRNVASFLFSKDTRSYVPPISWPYGITLYATVTTFRGVEAAQNCQTSTFTTVGFSPDCNTNVTPNDVCASAPLVDFTDLASYCVNHFDYTLHSPGNLEAEFCGGLHNNSFIRFTSPSDAIFIEFITFNCADDRQLQVQLLTTNDCITFREVPGACLGGGEDGEFPVSNLTPGAEYYLMVDGFAGGECSYNIKLREYCYLGDVALNTQEDVNAMLDLAPECFLNINNLRIGSLAKFRSGSDITDLTPLRDVVSITGDLIIEGNNALSQLDELSNLTTVGGDLRITNNASLNTLAGLESLQQLSGGLYITDNQQLSDISALTNIDATQLFGGSEDDLRIEDNPTLTNCDIVSVCNFLQLPSRNYAIQRNGMGCVTDGEVRQACGLLPVTWLDLGARSNGKSVSIDWRTARESSNFGFHLQYSVDGQDWEAIGFMPGNGTSQTIQNYTYVHAHPTAGLNYYRLEQEDFDGSRQLSPVVSVTFRVPSKLRVFPNPTNEFINITGSHLPGHKNTEVLIHDLTGREVLRAPKQTQIYIGDLPNGVYVVRMLGSVQGESVRFTKM